MFILKQTGNMPNILLQKFICDSVADLENIKEAQFCAECYVIDTKETYIMNSSGECVLKPTNGGSSADVANMDIVVLAEAQKYTDSLIENVYTKDQTYTKEEIDAMINS
jgi:alpha-galactosidase